MPDYTKQCWSCGKVTMVSKGDFYQCSECGATFSELANPTFTLIERGSISWQDDKGRRHRAPAYHVSKRAQNKAAKARAAKGGKLEDDMPIILK